MVRNHHRAKERQAQYLFPEFGHQMTGHHATKGVSEDREPLVTEGLPGKGDNRIGHGIRTINLGPSRGLAHAR